MRVPIRKIERFTYIKQDPQMTQQKLDELKADLASMLKQRPQLANDVRFYGANGDFSENAEYQIAKGKLRALNRKIDETRVLINKAIIIEPKSNSDVVEIGSTVVVDLDGKKLTYQILGSSETKPEQGIISYSSPVGQALLGKRAGDSSVVEINGKNFVYKIIKIG